MVNSAHRFAIQARFGVGKSLGLMAALANMVDDNSRRPQALLFVSSHIAAQLALQRLREILKFSNIDCGLVESNSNQNVGSAQILIGTAHAVTSTMNNKVINVGIKIYYNGQTCSLRVLRIHTNHLQVSFRT